MDNAVYCLGFTNSRLQARQFVTHNHFLVNGERVNIPSYLIRPGDVIQTREKSRNVEAIQEALERSRHQNTPDWLELDIEKQEGVVRPLPNVEQLAVDLQTQLTVEFYSK